MAIRRYLPLVAAASCILIASCGGSSSSSVTQTRLLGAIDKTRAIQSGRVVQRFSVLSPQGDIRGVVIGDANFASTAGTTLVEEGSVQEHAVFRDGTVWLTMNSPQ